MRTPATQPSGQSEPKRGLWSQLSTGGKVIIGLVVTGVVSGPISLFFTVYGPGLSDAVNPGPPVGIVQPPEDLPYVGKWALPGTPSPMPATVPSDQLPNILRTHGGVDVDELHLIGRRSQPVVITNITAHIFEKSQPVTGTLIDNFPQGADAGFNGCIYLNETIPPFGWRAQTPTSPNRFATRMPPKIVLR